MAAVLGFIYTYNKPSLNLKIFLHLWQEFIYLPVYTSFKQWKKLPTTKLSLKEVLNRHVKSITRLISNQFYTWGIKVVYIRCKRFTLEV